MAQERRRRDSFPKPPLFRLGELAQALQVIGDCLGGVRSGRSHLIVPIYGQLRSLLTERSRKAGPLLLEVAHNYGIELPIFAMSEPGPAAPPGSLGEKLHVHMAGFPISVTRQLGNQELITADQLLDRRLVFIKGTVYTVREIIEQFANRAGGSHYSAGMSADILELLSVRVGALALVPKALAQIAQTVLDLGVKVLREVGEFESHILIAVPPQKRKTAGYMMDWVRDEGSRVSLMLTPDLRLAFQVIGSNRVSAIVVSEEFIEWNRLRHVELVHEVLPGPSARLSIAVDGAKVAESNISFGLAIDADPLESHSYLNRSKEDPGAGVEFQLAEELMYKGARTIDEQAKLLAYFRSKLNKKGLSALSFSSGSYGYAPPGTNDLTLVGNVTRCRVGSSLDGEQPRP